MTQSRMTPALSKAVGLDPRPVSYPTLAAVETATDYQLLEWHRFLPSPTDEAGAEVVRVIMNTLFGSDL